MTTTRKNTANLRKILSTNKGAFICGVIWGILLFVLLYGTKILNVTYDDWLLVRYDSLKYNIIASGDLSQHYIGWMSYRNSAWTFPLGMMDCLSYPNSTSVIYTDSIPHFALVFKLLSPLLPETFQYFGLFGLFSFAMMGGFSCLMLKHFLKSSAISLILSSLFIYSPCVLYRMYGHTSLASQWIIICALYFWLCRPFEQHVYKKAAAWALLGFVAGGIHLYFLPMVAILCACTCLEDFLRKTKLNHLIIVFPSMLLGCICPLVIYGAFAGNVQKNSGGLGYYNSNLNTFFDPQRTSLFLKDLSHTDGQYEGYGYLGIGIIILLLINIFIWIYPRRSKIKVWNKSSKITIAVALILFTGLAVFPNVTFGDKTLLNFNFPEEISKLLGMFRAQGRFIWCVCYILFLISIVNVFNHLNTFKFIPRSLAVCLAIIQMLDLSPLLTYIHNMDKYQNYIEYTYDNINFSALEILFQAGKTNIIYHPATVYIHNQTDVAIASFAMKNNATLSTFYFARTVRGINEFETTINEELSAGIVREDCIYLFSDAIPYDNLYYYKWNDYTIGLSEEHPELENVCGLQRLDIPPTTQ